MNRAFSMFNIIYNATPVYGVQSLTGAGGADSRQNKLPSEGHRTRELKDYYSNPNKTRSTINIPPYVNPVQTRVYPHSMSNILYTPYTKCLACNQK